VVYVRNATSSVRSLELEFVEHIGRVLGAALASSVHLVRVILLDATFLVAAEGIASQVGVLIIQKLLSLVCLLS